MRLAAAILLGLTVRGQDILELPPVKADSRAAYGSLPQQFGDLYLPGGEGRHAVVAFIHGGFWRARYDLNHASHLCDALRKQGYAVWSIEYRRLGEEGGGYPGTIDDVLRGVNHIQRLAPAHRLDVKRVAVMGHSAGGHLAAVAASRLRWLRGAVPLAGVLDLQLGWKLGLSDGVVGELLGGSPEAQAARYKEASPVEMKPPAGRVVLLHGEADRIVPAELSDRYAKAFPGVTLRRFPGVGHFEWIDPRTPQFQEVIRALRNVFGSVR